MNRPPVADALDAREEGDALAVLGFGQDEDGPDLRHGLGQDHRRQDRRSARAVRQIALVERHVLDPDNPLVHLQLDDAIDEQERIAVRQDAFNRSVVERKSEVQEAIILGRRPADGRSKLRPYTRPVTSPATTNEQLTTLFALGREVASVLDLDELLHKIPQLIARLTTFQAFAVYLLDPKRNELTVAYSVGYPEEVSRTLRVKVGHGLVGAAVADGHPILVNDVQTDARYVEAVPGSRAELVVPLRRKGTVIGALNLLSDTVGQFTKADEMMLRQFGAHVAIAIENALLVEHDREYTPTLETLAE